jgi:hypothetical protein
MFGRGLRRLIVWPLIISGISLASLSLIALGTYPIGDSFLSMTLKQWGFIISYGAGLLMGLVMLVIGEAMLPRELRASMLRPRNILLRAVGVVFILTGILLNLAAGMLFLIGSLGRIENQDVFALVVMALFGLASIVFGAWQFLRVNMPTTG